MNEINGNEKVQPIIFVDDAHTFGGAQIALAWAICTVLRHCSEPVVCVCTAATRDAIRQFTGEHEKLCFIECLPALPLNIFMFPLRLWSFYKLLAPLVRQGESVWWFNLAGIEFCLAPLLILKALGLHPIAWLHGSQTLQSCYANVNQSAARRWVDRLRDGVADRLVFGVYTRIITPSHAAEQSLKTRLRSSNPPLTGYLYPIVGLQPERASIRRSETDSSEGRIDLWMISRVDFRVKNNLACLQILKHLRGKHKNAYLTVVGDGPDMADFRNSTCELGLSEFVSFKGWQKNPWEFVPEAGIVLIPSLFEGMPLVATEAMLHGVRMVTSPIPAFYEGSPNELIARDFSAESFVEKIEEVSAMSRERLLALYKLALAKFTEEEFVVKFQSIVDAATKASLGRKAV